MHPFCELLPPENIGLDLEISSRKRAFEEAGLRLERSHGVGFMNVVVGLAKREKLGSTALGEGMALPHARIQGLSRPVAAFIRPRYPLPFDAPDAKPVSDILVLLIPEGQDEQHVQLLAAIAQRLRDRDFRKRLRKCRSPASVSELFAGDPER